MTTDLSKKIPRSPRAPPASKDLPLNEREPRVRSKEDRRVPPSRSGIRDLLEVDSPGKFVSPAPPRLQSPPAPIATQAATGNEFVGLELFVASDRRRPDANDSLLQPYAQVYAQEGNFVTLKLPPDSFASSPLGSPRGPMEDSYLWAKMSIRRGIDAGRNKPLGSELDLVEGKIASVNVDGVSSSKTDASNVAPQQNLPSENAAFLPQSPPTWSSHTAAPLEPPTGPTEHPHQTITPTKMDRKVGKWKGGFNGRKSWKLGNDLDLLERSVASTRGQNTQLYTTRLHESDEPRLLSSSLSEASLFKTSPGYTKFVEERRLGEEVTKRALKRVADKGRFEAEAPTPTAAAQAALEDFRLADDFAQRVLEACRLQSSHFDTGALNGSTSTLQLRPVPLSVPRPDQLTHVERARRAGVQATAANFGRFLDESITNLAQMSSPRSPEPQSRVQRGQNGIHRAGSPIHAERHLKTANINRLPATAGVFHRIDGARHALVPTLDPGEHAPYELMPPRSARDMYWHQP